MTDGDTMDALRELVDGVKQPYLWPRHLKALRAALTIMEDIRAREARSQPPYIEDPRCPHCHGTGLN